MKKPEFKASQDKDLLILQKELHEAKISSFLEKIKNSGVIMIGEPIIHRYMIDSENPMQMLIEIVTQGRKQGISFYERGIGMDIHAAAKAFDDFGGVKLVTAFRMFLANIRRNPDPIMPEIADYY